VGSISLNKLYDRGSAIHYDEVRTGHSHLWEVINERYPFPAKGAVADIGCGTGNESQFLARYIDTPLTLIDKSVSMLNAAQVKLGEQAVYIQADASKAIGVIPDCSYDYLVCSFVYHHIQSKQDFFKEMFRILKPDGRFVVLGATLEQALVKPLAVFFPGLKECDGLRYLALDDLIEVFCRAGFAKVETLPVLFEKRTMDESYLAAISPEKDSGLKSLSNAQLEDGLTRIHRQLKNPLSVDVYRTILTGIRSRLTSDSEP
jgi:SAM-dependent methyltransferase